MLVWLATGVYAQTASDMETVLGSGAVSFAQVCRFVLPAAEAVSEEGAGEAFARAVERGWLPGNAAADGAVRLGELSFLIMKAFNLKGSFLYALFPGPRYAYRELVYRRFVPAVSDPSARVSGALFFRILANVLGEVGNEPELEPFVPEPVVVSVPDPQAAQEAAQEAAREVLAAEIRVELTARQVTDTSVRVADEGVVISLNNIQFLPDQVVLTEAERVKLMKIGVILSRYPDRKILVGGHTALAGSEEGRVRISTERARAVADFLVYLDVRAEADIRVQGYGAQRPLGDNRTEQGQELNRRVEITLLEN
jgi:outer membrane protein OmpA-like peptidoglycan-associated protein